MAGDLSMPVLIVDDYQAMIRIIRNLLTQLGFRSIDERVGCFCAALDAPDTAQTEFETDARNCAQLLNGPATSQHDIDAMFA